MAIKIKSLSNCVGNTGLKILVHGPAGAGKTVLCATTGAPTLIISAEAGLLSIRNAPKYIKAAEVQTLDDIQDLYEYLLENASEPDFEWVALDSISEIAEKVLAYEKTSNKDPRAAYGNLQEHMMKLLRDFRDLPGYNVIMTCKQQRVNDESLGFNMYMPMMPGAKLAQQIPYLFDEVFALRVEKDEEKVEYRVLQTVRDARYEAKDRSGILEPFEEPNLKKILAKIKQDIPEFNEKKQKETEPDPAPDADDKEAEEVDLCPHDIHIDQVCKECEAEADEESENDED